MSIQNIVPISGVTFDLLENEKLDALNLELISANGSPVILVNVLSDSVKSHLFKLSLREAIDLKAKLEVLLFDYLENREFFN
jgi:hypothetical protein